MEGKTHQGPYKREEGFRVILSNPIQASFSIVKSGNRIINSKEGSIFIEDISLQGIRLNTHLDLPLNIILGIRFKMNSKEMMVSGEVVWKNHLDDKYYYGFKMDGESYSREALLDELKTFVRNENK